MTSKVIHKPHPHLNALADAIHWPECWDTAAYPTLTSALSEVAASFRCTNQDTHTQGDQECNGTCVPGGPFQYEFEDEIDSEFDPEDEGVPF